MRDDRPLRGREELVVYLLAGVTYVLAGLAWKGLLNWIVGPAWIVAWVWLAPLVVDRSRARRARGRRARA